MRATSSAWPTCRRALAGGGWRGTLVVRVAETPATGWRALLPRQPPSPATKLAPPVPTPSPPANQVPDPSHSDHLVLARLALARADPLKAVDAREAVRAAAAKVRRLEGSACGLAARLVARGGAWGACPSRVGARIAAAVRRTAAPPACACPPPLPSLPHLAQQVASWLGEEPLREALEQADPTAAEQLQRLLAGQPIGAPASGAGAGSSAPSSSA